MTTTSSTTFERFCGDEMIRQTLRGHRVPNANTPIAYAQWKAHAQRTFDSAVCGHPPPTIIESVPCCVFPLPTAADVATSALVLRHNAAQQGASHPQQLKAQYRFSPAEEIETLLQSHEVLLRLFFHSMLSVLELEKERRDVAVASGGDAHIPVATQQAFASRREALNRTIKFTQDSLKQTQSPVQQLDRDGTLAPHPDRYGHVHALTELFSFYRLLRNRMKAIPLEKQHIVVETSQIVAKRYEGPAFAALSAALHQWSLEHNRNDDDSTSDAVDSEQLRVLGVLAAVTIPFQFPSSTGPAIRAAFPEASEPNARLAPIPGPRMVSEAVGEDVDCDSADDIQSVTSTNDSDDGKTGVVLPNKASAVPLHTRQQKRTATLLHSGKMDAPTMASAGGSGGVSKRARAESPDNLTLGDVLRAAPVPAAAASSGRQGTSLQMPPNNNSASGVVVVRAVAPAATTAGGRPHTPHVYPCRSKYHAAFVADPKKHASRECTFCTVCHMLEFLFNGCKVDCCWKHEPTPRKIQVHLRAFPAVYRLADKRMQDWSRGVFLEPMELPQ